MHAATKLSIAETFKAAKQSFEMATHAEGKIDDFTAAMLEVHAELYHQCGNIQQALQLVAADTMAQQ